MFFNFRLFFRHLSLSLFTSGKDSFRLTPKRVLFLFAFFLVYPSVLVFTWICFGLDHVLFPRFRKIEIKKPVFITGLFRSGTTFLHKSLAQDTENFTAMKTWEIYLAPSILQRKILFALGHIDRVFGSPGYKLIRYWEQKSQKDNRLHRVSLFEPEEDEGLFLFQWQGLFLWYLFPDMEGVKPYLYFDSQVSGKEKEKMFRYYRNCIRRHLFCYPESRYFLSKNPSSSPRLETLIRFFPDARILHLVRDPDFAIPSVFNLFAKTWELFTSPVEEFPFSEDILQFCRHWYEYPLKVVRKQPLPGFKFIDFKAFVGNPEEMVREIYQSLKLDPGFPMEYLLQFGLPADGRQRSQFKKNRLKKALRKSIMELAFLLRKKHPVLW